ncbi:hypothetical protein bcgnr5372_53160 [Bacillus luti]
MNYYKKWKWLAQNRRALEALTKRRFLPHRKPPMQRMEATKVYKNKRESQLLSKREKLLMKI